MYDKFDRLQVALTNVLRTQLAMMGVRLEERLEARLDKRIAERLQTQTEQLRDVMKAVTDRRPNPLAASEPEHVDMDEDLDDEFPADEDEVPLSRR